MGAHIWVSYMALIYGAHRGRGDVNCMSTRLLCVRYVWANRTALARSVHDMAKQMYSNKKYSDVAWAPLGSWLFKCDDAVARERGEMLLKFHRGNLDFFSVVAQCLWNLANGANTPWGRAATQPRFYDHIPIHEKVIGGGVKPRCPFFFCRDHIRDTYMCGISVCPSMVPA